MWKQANLHSSISARSAALLFSLLAPLAACATPSTWGYASAPVAEPAAPTTWGYATPPAGEPATQVGFSKQPEQPAGPTIWGFARLPAAPAASPVAMRR